MKRPLQLGAAVLAIYVAVALGTLAWSGHAVRPLFEGVGPPPAYNWVKPPVQFAANNSVPKPKVSDIPLNGPATGPAVAATDDGQFVVNLAQGSLLSHVADTNVHAVITPLDPAKLAPPPAGLAADGNAYRIELTYEPSGVAVSALAVPGDVIMTAPHNTASLLYAPDGSVWQKLASQQVGTPTTIGSSFTHAGYYLVASKSQSTGSGSSKGGVGTILIAVSVAAGAAVLGLIAWVVAARRREARKRRGRQGRRR